MADERLLTRYMTTRGGGKVEVIANPRSNRVRIHIAEQPGVMRIQRAALNGWLHTRGYPPQQLIDQFVAEFNATTTRAALGGGTIFASPQTHIVEIPLAGPLAGYIELPASPNNQSNQNNQSMGAKLAGNQPTI
jgi:hypothetical protein